MKPKLLEYMEEKHRREPDIMLFFMLTNIIEESTTLLCWGGKSAEALNAVYGAEASAEGIPVPGMVSRKKQFLPDLIAELQKE